MKIVRLIIFITLITFTLHLRKAEKKVERRIKANKFTWESSYKCDIQLNGQKAGVGNYTPNSLSNPKNEETIGWVFEMSKGPFVELANIMYRIGDTNKWVFPYRLMSSDLTYTNPIFGNKYFSFTVTTDTTKVVYNIVVVLPWKLLGYIISDEEARQCINWINSLKSTQKASVTKNKTNAITAGTSLINNKLLLAAAQKGNNELDTKMTQAQSAIDKANDTLKKDKEVFESSNKELLNLQKNLTDKKTKQQELLSNIQANKALMQTKQKSKLELEGKAANSESLKLKNKLDADITDINNNYNVLIAGAPTAKSLIDKAKEAALNLIKDGIAININRIYAGN